MREKFLALAALVSLHSQASAASRTVVINSIDAAGQVSVAPMPKGELDKYAYNKGEYWIAGTDKVAGFSIDDARAFYRDLFEAIRGNFVVKTSFEDMANRLLESLDTYTNGVQITITDTRMLVHSKGLKLLGNFAKPDEDDPQAWANAVVNILLSIRQGNREVADMPQERLYHITALYLLKSLDSNAEYLDKSGARTARGQRNTSSLGFTYRRLPFGIQVLSTMAGSPMALSPISEGDAITHINTLPVEKMSDEQLESALSGDESSIAGINYISYASSRPGEIFLRKNRAYFEPAGLRTVDGIPFLTIYNLEKGSAAFIASLLSNADLGKGIVIDARAAAGGSALEAFEAANLFIDGGDLAYTVGADGSSTAFEAKPGDIADGAPIIVLANNTTRGAAEIFAFVLDTRKRAVSVGSPTFGNGNMAQRFPIAGGHAAYFATRSVYSADGFPLSKVGLAPLV
ncbi:MAG: PDZ domain-containing protein, partial [Rickettsiales bacterium]|nr:PDZ domain-containing protein [Rickettsiales bacterium]